MSESTKFNFDLSESKPREMSLVPVVFKDKGATANFQTELEFTITPQNNSGTIVLFIASEGIWFPSNRGGKLGIFQKSGITFGVLAVIATLDTDNPNNIRIDVLIESLEPAKFMNIPLTFLGDNKWQFKVSYDSARKIITVSVSAPDGKTYEVVCPCDLSQVLTPNVLIGFAASTDVYSWEFSSKFP